MFQSAGSRERAGVAAAEDQRDRRIERGGAARRTSAQALRAAVRGSAPAPRAPPRVAGCALRAHRRARRIHSSTPAVPRAARDVVGGSGNCRQHGQRQQRGHGPETQHGYSPSETNKHAARSAGVELLVDQEGMGGARERNAEKARCGTWQTASLRARRSGRRGRRSTTVGAPPTTFCIEREGDALAAELALRGRGVRIGFEVRAGVHHHAELGEQQRQRQHMHEPAAIASNQNSLRARVFPQAPRRQARRSNTSEAVTCPKFHGRRASTAFSDVGAAL